MKVTEKQLRQIIREELERLQELVAEPEAYNARELATAASQTFDQFKAAAEKWVKNAWGLAKATDNKQLAQFVKQANDALGFVKKAPPMMMNK